MKRLILPLAIVGIAFIAASRLLPMSANLVPGNPGEESMRAYAEALNTACTKVAGCIETEKLGARATVEMLKEELSASYTRRDPFDPFASALNGAYQDGKWDGDAAAAILRKLGSQVEGAVR